MLVEFYAPWCSFCKAFAPEYAAASAQLASLSNYLPVVVAKVDADSTDGGKALRDKYNVTGYPTLIWFVDGKPQPYGGDMGGRADIVLRFGAGEEAWVLEVGVGVDSGSKLLQAQVYGEAQLEPRVLCCAVVVAKQGSASTVAIGSAAPLVITVAWSQRTRKAGGGGLGEAG